MGGAFAGRGGRRLFLQQLFAQIRMDEQARPERTTPDL